MVLFPPKIYDKRNDFDFDIENFSFFWGVAMFQVTPLLECLTVFPSVFR